MMIRAESVVLVHSVIIGIVYNTPWSISSDNDDNDDLADLTTALKR